MKRTKNIFYYLTLSISAAFLLLMLTFFSYPDMNIIQIYDKLVIGGIFITSCKFGVSLAIYPRWFRKYTKHINRNSNHEQSREKKIEYKGHHPYCKRFKNHTIITKNKVFCAGCLGIAIGSIISIILMTIYIITKAQSIISFHFIILSGLIIIGLVYIEIMLPKRHAVIHVISNVFLIVSFLLITVGTFEVTGNIIYGMLSILLAFLWIDTRIQLSSWRHYSICNNCNETCKMY